MLNSQNLSLPNYFTMYHYYGCSGVTPICFVCMVEAYSISSGTFSQLCVQQCHVTPSMVEIFTPQKLESVHIRVLPFFPESPLLSIYCPPIPVGIPSLVRAIVIPSQIPGRVALVTWTRPCVMRQIQVGSCLWDNDLPRDNGRT